MTDNPTPAEAVDLERLEKVARALLDNLGATNNLGYSPHRIAFSEVITPAVVLALLSRLKAADQRAAELAAQNAVLRAAVEQLRPDYDENEARQRSYMDDPEISETERSIYQRRIDHVRRHVAIIDTALATTPAEALEVVREMQQTIADMVRGVQLGAKEAGLDPEKDEAVKQGNAAIDAARRVFGPTRGEE